MNTWPFTDPPDTVVTATVHVLDGQLPINLVTRDPVAGWEFLWARLNDPRDGRRASLSQVLHLEPRIAELAHLPLGWWASRPGPDAPWLQSPRPDVDHETWL
jgi:hypothetical protein